MNSSALGSAVIALVAGVVGAGSLLMMQSLGDSSQPEIGAVTTQQVASLQLQLTDIAAGQSELQRRMQQFELDAMRGRSNPNQPTASLLGPESVTALQDQLSLLSATVTEMGDGDGPAMFTIEDVGSALATIRDQEDTERDARREEQREERLVERLAAAGTELALDGYQAQQLEDAARLSMDGLDETMAAVRESGDWGSMRSSMEEARTAFDTNMGLFMNQDQLASFGEMGGLSYLSGFGGPGGGGGGRRGGRGGDR
ncbi:MAG: hypothetical protein ACI9EF_001659 [Pseudohongiellaceae bacterium]|jgi:hypothetical protein